MLCVLEGTAFSTGVGGTAVAGAGCNNNWNTWWLGSRTQWNVTPDTYFALEVFYESMKSASSVNGVVPTGVIPTATTATTGQSLGSNDNYMLRFRVHKDFYP